MRIHACAATSTPSCPNGAPPPAERRLISAASSATRCSRTSCAGRASVRGNEKRLAPPRQPGGEIARDLVRICVACLGAAAIPLQRPLAAGAAAADILLL